jgi:outer membrane cobalamin receptor
MAPFVIFMDPYTFFSGNPALQPSIADAVNIAYIYKKKMISVSYSYETNTITNFSPRVDPATNIQTLAAENQKSDRILAVSMSSPFEVTKWWSIQNNVIGTHEHLSANFNKPANKSKTISHGLKTIKPAAKKAIVMISCNWLNTCESNIVRPMVCCRALSILS